MIINELMSYLRNQGQAAISILSTGNIVNVLIVS